MRTPSTAISSVAASALPPRIATRPLTVTAPDSISSSHVRRLPSPARARIFCRRSLNGVGQQPLLELLDHVGPWHELAEARQVVDGVETESFEEQLRRAVQHGHAR